MTGTAERARDVVGRRLLDAAYREDIDGVRTSGRWSHLPARRHGFDRIAVAAPVTEAPATLLADIGVTDAALVTELDDAIGNLAVAYGRRTDIDNEWRKRAAERGCADAYGVVSDDAADDQAIAFERLATDGHNLHPCGRTRLGWSAPDVLAYDQEAAPFDIGFVALRRDLHLGDDIGARLAASYPQVPAAPPGYVVQPVHPWQRSAVLHERHARLFADGVLRDLGGSLRAAPTTALRTLLLEPSSAGARHYLKLSLDIQVTSTRRSISIASTRNGPPISALLTKLTAGDERIILMPEIAGAAMSSGRDVAAIVRGGLDHRLGPGEVALPGAALPAISPITGKTLLAEAVDRFGATRGLRSPAGRFLIEYAHLLLSVVLRLLDAGIGLEAHLQNCIPIFRDGVPIRMALRDFAGLRLHLPRLAAHSELRLWPGSVIGTDDIDVVRAKIGYTALQAHLGEVVAQLTTSYALDEDEAWRSVRGVIDAIYAGDRLDAADHAFFVAPTMPHKALVRMRLAGGSDIYVPVRNPLHHVG
jgi:D-ornithine---citrate ligase